jgi:hypothetical protein
MATEKAWTQQLTEEFIEALELLRNLDDDQAWSEFEQALGAGSLTNSQRTAIVALGSDVSNAYNNYLTTADPAQVATLAAKVVTCVKHLRALSPGGSGSVDWGGGLGFVTSRFLRRKKPSWAALLHFLGILEDGGANLVDSEALAAVSGVSAPTSSNTAAFRPQKLLELFGGLQGWASTTYGWGATFDSSRFFSRLLELITTTVPDAGIYPLPFWLAKDGTRREIRASLFRTGSIESGYGELGLAIHPLDRLGSSVPGIVCTLFGAGQLAAKLYETEDFVVSFNSNMDLSDGLSVVLAPNRPIGFLLGAGHEAGSTEFGGIQVSVQETTPRKVRMLHQNSFSYVSLTGISARAGLFGDPKKLEAIVEVACETLAAGIDTSGFDGFIKNVINVKLDVAFAIASGWSSVNGVYFLGKGAGEVFFPIHKKIGPVRLDGAYVRLGSTSSAKLLASLGISGAVALGPIVATVDRIGIQSPLALDSDFDFGGVQLLPPQGVGLAIQSELFTGGGFLKRHVGEKKYSGAVQLALGEIGMFGIGIINSDLPASKGGFALLVNFGVTFSPGWPLPYGFRLSAIGGLAGVHRSVSYSRLKHGLKAGTLSSILMPEDVVLNANKIIADSEYVFPIERDRHFFGPVAEIQWGGEGMVDGKIAVIIEVPQPITITVLGQVTAKLPRPEVPQVVIRLDTVGQISPSKKTLEVDAKLLDSSRLMVYPLDGSAALRASWKKSSATFLMAVGGVHPRYSPPPKFPKLKRIRVTLKSTDNFHLEGKCFLALSSQAIMAGAKLDLKAEACGAALVGDVSFSTLIQPSPFEFQADISGKISAEYRGHSVAAVRINVDFSGVAPFHAKGRAKFSVLRWDVTAKFNRSWGSDNKQRLAKVDPWGHLVDALRSDGNWGAALLSGHTQVDGILPFEQVGAASAAILAHPGSVLEVRQRVMPLDLTLEKFGNADVKHSHKYDFSLSIPSASGVTFESEPVEDQFAKGQFRDLSVSRRLSSPSFEDFKAGSRLKPTKARIDGTVVPYELEYESIVIGKDEIASSPKVAKLDWAVFKKTAAGSAWARSRIRNRGASKFAVPGAGPRVEVRNEAYSVVEPSSLKRDTVIQPFGGKRLNQTQAEDLVAENRMAVASGAQVPMVVPEYEERST